MNLILQSKNLNLLNYNNTEYILFIYQGNTILINNIEYPIGYFKLNGLFFSKNREPGLLLIIGNFKYVDGVLYPILDGSYKLRYTSISDQLVTDDFIEEYNFLIETTFQICSGKIINDISCDNIDKLFIPANYKNIISLLISHNDIIFPLTRDENIYIYYAHFNNNKLVDDLEFYTSEHYNNIISTHFEQVNIKEINDAYGKFRIYSQSEDKSYFIINHIELYGIYFMINIDDIIDSILQNYQRISILRL